MLSDIMLNVVFLSVIMLSVVAYSNLMYNSHLSTDCSAKLEIEVSQPAFRTDKQTA
jgi:hypothetical protein